MIQICDLLGLEARQHKEAVQISSHGYAGMRSRIARLEARFRLLPWPSRVSSGYGFYSRL